MYERWVSFAKLSSKVRGRVIASITETIQVNEKRVACDGGNGPLGHPRIFLEIGAEGEVVCPYCSRQYILSGTEKTDAA